MKSTILLLIAGVLAFPLLLQAEPANHDHGASAPHKIELNAGRKWATDAALRKGMTAIRALVETALPAAHTGRLTPAQYDVLANDVNAQITYVVQHCKLDPKADAQLHIVIGDMAKGVETIQGKHSDKARSLGVVELSQAMNTYGEFFNHTGWQPIKLPH
ncbi:MAG TPA: hypothetical protein VN277_01790 [Acidiferrobacterales bacterium]|nr:hypothetical protein [Acidiferrobacterales bacterium]